MNPERPRLDQLAQYPAILRGGLRPFFLGGALWALSVLALWIGAQTGVLSLPTAFDPLAWHRHEMLFGYLAAVIGNATGVATSRKIRFTDGPKPYSGCDCMASSLVGRQGRASAPTP